MAAGPKTGAEGRAIPPVSGTYARLSPDERADAPVGYGLSATAHVLLLAGVFLGGELFVARDTQSVEVIEFNLLSASEFEALGTREAEAPAEAPRDPPPPSEPVAESVPEPVPEEPAPVAELPDQFLEPEEAEESVVPQTALPEELTSVPPEEVVEEEVPDAPDPPLPPREVVEEKAAEVPEPPADLSEPPPQTAEELAALVPVARPEHVRPAPVPDVAEELTAILGKGGDTTAPSAGALFSSDLSGSERAYLRRKVSNCWNASAIVGARNAHTLRVTVGVDFTADGHLRQSPVLVRPQPLPSAAHRTALDAARAALIRCAPYDRLPSHQYERWRRLEFTFDPTGMVDR